MKVKILRDLYGPNLHLIRHPELMYPAGSICEAGKQDGNQTIVYLPDGSDWWWLDNKDIEILSDAVPAALHTLSLAVDWLDGIHQAVDRTKDQDFEVMLLDTLCHTQPIGLPSLDDVHAALKVLQETNK